jgi:hypothetical protein
VKLLRVVGWFLVDSGENMSFSLNFIPLNALGGKENDLEWSQFSFPILLILFSNYIHYSLAKARMVDDCLGKNTNWSVHWACSLHCASPDRHHLTLQQSPLSDMSCSCCHIHDRMTRCGRSSNPVPGRCSPQCSNNYCNRNYYLTNSRNEENYNTAFLNMRSSA